MAFTEAQRVSIRKYLGWPARANSSTQLEGAIGYVEGNTAAEAEVVVVLGNLAAIETEIAAMHSLALASSVEGSTLDPTRMAKLQAAGRRECGQLAILLGCEIARDAFGGSSSGWMQGPLGWG